MAVYATSDGKYINLCCLQAGKYWAEACHTIGRPDLADDPRFADDAAIKENLLDATAELRATFATRTAAEWRALADTLDHNNLNDLEPFRDVEPSAENQAKYFFGELKRKLPPEMRDAIVYVRVWETPTQWAQYSERRLVL